MAEAFIQVRGARTNNLKNMDVDIPRNKLVVITGKSGSGKSSLAIDTVFAEGQRQFLESLSLYSRQFFKQGFATDVDSIEGLPPTICINQNRGSINPRSTVGTITEIYDYFRLLFSKLGIIQCPTCDIAVKPQSLDSICERILELPERTKVMVMANMVTSKKGKHADTFEKIRKERLVRVRLDGEVFDIDNLPEINTNKHHTIDAITDRIMVREGIESRLHESVELANQLSGSSVTVSFCISGSEQWQEEFFSTSHACPQCGMSCPDLLPRTFSFNSPFGACAQCEGLGIDEAFDLSRLIPNYDLRLSDAVVPWGELNKRQVNKQLKLLKPLVEELGIDSNPTLSSLSKTSLDRLLGSCDKDSPGLLTILQRELASSLDEDWLETLEAYVGKVACEMCYGSRLNEFARAVKIQGRSISDFCSMQFNDLLVAIEALEFEGADREIAETVLSEVRYRLQYLNKVGLEYLTLNRSSDSLSGGELQRVRLAKSIGSGLTGACYVLDEPSIGLHQRDNDRLIETIRDLRDRGNSIVVVEHDETIMQVADHLIDVGPQAGQGGGEIVIAGTCEEVENCSNSLTGKYLTGQQKVERNINEGDFDQFIELKGARGNNLKSIDVRFQLQRLNCVTGVSGSGKSTLVYRTLAPAIKQHFELVTMPPDPYDSIVGLELIDRFVEVDQKPISRNPRGCAATYTGVFEDVRKIFAATRAARQLGFTASRFSFNTKQGWCAACEGHGVKRISMKFMPDVFATCENCRGQRFNAQTLSVRFRDLNIAQVLSLPVNEALDYFSEFSEIHRRLKTLQDVGLGYLSLGQRSNTLSGGEAQRIKLASELSKTARGHTLYLLDEPTTGLHLHDVQLLLSVLDSLVKQGNTVVVIEHHMDVIRCSDWLLDIGPEGGAGGGQLVAAGRPGDVQKIEQSHTGRYLKTALSS